MVCGATQSSGVSSVLIAPVFWDQGVVSSSLAAPTSPFFAYLRIWKASVDL